MLHILHFIGPEGQRRYGLRFQDVPEYDEFYQWVYTTSYECIGCDMPWDYFYFKDPADDFQFWMRYGNGIYLDNREYTDRI